MSDTTPVTTEALQSAGLLPSATATSSAQVAPVTIPTTVPVTQVKAPNTVFAVWAAALYPALITLGTAAAVLPKHHTQLDLVQFAIVVAGVLGAVFAKVLPTVGWWPGILKTGILIVAAVLTLVPPLLAAHGDFAHIDATSWILFGVAAVNAAAHEIGIQQRTAANQKTEENLLK